MHVLLFVSFSHILSKKRMKKGRQKPLINGHKKFFGKKQNPLILQKKGGLKVGAAENKFKFCLICLLLDKKKNSFG